MRPTVFFRCVATFALGSLLLLGGCGSLLTESASVGAGVGGAAVANSVTKNGAVTAGIGLGAQAAAQAGVQYLERRTHKAEQDEIAKVAGTLLPGSVARWQIHHRLPIESDEQGQVTVSRIIAAPVPGATPAVDTLSCKEIVFSVDTQPKDRPPERAFYTAAICQDGPAWKWASAEPATERWGSLQ
jgi:hypothetical protein